VLGWEVTYSDENYGMVSDGTTSIGFGKVEGYAPPSWPDTGAPKRYHLDLQVEDIDDAARKCEALGAQVPAFQPGGDRWRVMLDPGGHPFCLCRKMTGPGARRRQRRFTPT
ncbi:MAG TPA: VOC family protein, partial [Acidimicrobiales bacterium]|nr:VOC family protein [Acidimicrobiales bacterium]